MYIVYVLGIGGASLTDVKYLSGPDDSTRRDSCLLSRLYFIMAITLFNAAEIGLFSSLRP